MEIRNKALASPKFMPKPGFLMKSCNNAEFNDVVRANEYIWLNKEKNEGGYNGWTSLRKKRIEHKDNITPKHNNLWHGAQLQIYI
jgi:hypothetical protein